jgi:hypothetical protein
MLNGQKQRARQKAEPFEWRIYLSAGQDQWPSGDHMELFVWDPPPAVVLNICKAFILFGTLDDVQPLKKEIAFFLAVKAAISKDTSIDKKRTETSRSVI